MAYQQAVKRAPKFVSKWEENGQTKITLKVNDEEELCAILAMTLARCSFCVIPFLQVAFL